MMTEVTARLNFFEPALPSDVKRIVLASAVKSCELDPLPTSLLKCHIDSLSPVLARIINASLSSSVVPPSMKHAVITPILKKRGSDINVPTNYRPISNITFVAKITERFVAQQLQHFMDENGIYGVYQSAYRPHHSAETMLLRIHNDVAQAIDSRWGVLLVLLDLTAAFDTIDHTILLRRLRGYGLCGDVHAWLTSYLHNRTNVVRVKSSLSDVNKLITLQQEYRKGRFLDLYFLMPTLLLFAKLLHQHNMQHHLYADDTQLYVTFPPTDHMQALARMEACIQEVKTWLCDNGLVMNENQSEAIVIRSPSLRTPITFSGINICGQFIDTSAVIRDLGFAIDTHLSMASQVSNICRSAYYHLVRIAKIRDSLTTSVCKSLIHGLVTSRLDHGNAMLFLITDRLLHRLEMVQRSAIRIVMQIRWGDHQSMTIILWQLHWLPIKRRIEYKILILVHKALYEGTPEYLAALLHQYAPRCCLRSAGGLLLDVPRVSRRAFACAGPTPWNKLPANICGNGNHPQFKKLLKTFLFFT